MFPNLFLLMTSRQLFAYKGCLYRVVAMMDLLLLPFDPAMGATNEEEHGVELVFGVCVLEAIMVGFKPIIPQIG